MKKFRKKPVVIEAEKFESFYSLSKEFQLQLWSGTGTDKRYYIPTLEGNMFIEPGDWIIKGIKGEFYPCKPDIFEATYEAVHQVKPSPLSDEDFAKLIEDL